MKLFYEESKATSQALLDLVGEYRANTTKVLALATGALALFGFEDSDKGWWYIAALVAYAVGVGVALWIYLPVKWRLNPAQDVPEAVAAGRPLPVAKAHFDLGRAHQANFTQNRMHMTGLKGIPVRFTSLVIASALVIVCGGVNTITSDPPAPSSPTEIIILDESS